jgi:D-cysteine desulfhydrase
VSHFQHPERLRLAQLPTPVQPARRLSQQLGVELLVKRDDLTGTPLSGNKIRKLEYLLHEAGAYDSNVTIITCGGEQSNHCRATAIAATQVGMRSYLLLRTDDPAHPPAPDANILLDRLVGADIRWVSREEYKRRAQLFVEVQGQLLAQGRKSHVIPEGGSNALGSWGYVRCVEELAEQLGDGPVTLVYAAGSGGTGAGLITGIKLLGLPWRAVAVNVCDDKDYFVAVIGEIVEQMIARWQLPLQFDRSEIEIIDGYVGAGYARSRPEELALLRDVARAEALILDPVYTGKAYYGMAQELARDRRRLGERICFLHTGGIYGLFPKAHELAPLL